jgi:CRP-like cAMP-binding protein
MIPPSSSPLHPLIRKLESITTLSDDEKQAIASLPTRARTLPPRQEIVRDGDRPSQCCLIVEGWLYRTKTLSDGKRQILALHVPGDMPDLQSLHLPVLDHTLSTLTQAIVAFIPHESLHHLVAAHPGITAALWRDTLIDAAIFREWITGLGRRDARGRIAHLFCEMYIKLHAVGLAADYRCDFPPTQTEMSDALGLSTVHVNRVVQELRAEQLISWQGRSLEILDWKGLVEAGEFDPVYLHVAKRAAA